MSEDDESAPSLESIAEQLRRLTELENAHYTELMLKLQALSDEKEQRESIAAGDDEHDELYDDAREVVVGAGKASTSFLQRRLGIGYARACHLIDMLEQKGVIGPADGAKPREVLETEDELDDAA